MKTDQNVTKDLPKTDQKKAVGFAVNLETRKMGLRKPKQVWEFDRTIRNWTGDSARSQVLVR